MLEGSPCPFISLSLAQAVNTMFRPDDLGDIGQRVAGRPILLQDVQVYTDLCPGLVLAAANHYARNLDMVSKFHNLCFCLCLRIHQIFIFSLCQPLLLLMETVVVKNFLCFHKVTGRHPRPTPGIFLKFAGYLLTHP